MGHSYNNGLHTTSKAITYDRIRVTGLNTTPCTIAEDCKSGLISAVTKGSTGVYTFQLTLPYPPKVVEISAHISSAAATSTLLFARYQNASYNATTGQFIVNVCNATPTATDGGASDELHVSMAFNRYTR